MRMQNWLILMRLLIVVIDIIHALLPNVARHFQNVWVKNLVMRQLKNVKEFRPSVFNKTVAWHRV